MKLDDLFSPGDLGKIWNIADSVAGFAHDYGLAASAGRVGEMSFGDPKLTEFAVKNDYPVVVRRPDGKLIAISFMFGHVDLIVGDEWVVDERYSYSSLMAAAIQLILWIAEGFAGQPRDWSRHTAWGVDE